MADSFADLWASSAPAKQTQKSKPLGVSLSKKPTSSVQRSQWDAFSALSASQPTSRIHSPHFARTQALTKNASDSQTQGEADAFSELLDASSGFGGGTADGAFSNMSMAERAALVHKAALQRPQQGQTMSAAWNDIDALSQVGTFHTPAVAQSTAGDDFALEFGSAQLDQAKYDSETAKTACPSSARSTQMYQPQTTQARPASLWDLDEFASNLPSDTQQSELGSARTNTKSADCNDGSVLLDRDTQDDILGDLGKPAVRTFSSALVIFLAMSMCARHPGKLIDNGLLILSAERLLSRLRKRILASTTSHSYTNNLSTSSHNRTTSRNGFCTSTCSEGSRIYKHGRWIRCAGGVRLASCTQCSEVS